MKLLNGKKLSEKIYKKIKKKIDKLNLKPRLDIILVGEDYSSQLYVKMKKKKAEHLGIKAKVHKFETNSTEAEVLKLIDSLNKNPKTNGIMVQLPLPKHINMNKVLNKIDYEKDVDGLTAYNLGLIYQGKPNLIAATPLGIVKLLKEYKISLEGKVITIIGTSPYVGLPLVGLLNSMGGTITLCHSKTINIKQHSQKADILISATGQPHLIEKDWIKKQAIVIDVGIEKDPQTGKLVGDVNFEKVAPKTSFITPVPGGIGPMTVASLMDNVVKVSKSKIKKNPPNR